MKLLFIGLLIVSATANAQGLKSYAGNYTSPGTKSRLDSEGDYRPGTCNESIHVEISGNNFIESTNCLGKDDPVVVIYKCKKSICKVDRSFEQSDTANNTLMLLEDGNYILSNPSLQESFKMYRTH